MRLGLSMGLQLTQSLEQEHRDIYQISFETKEKYAKAFAARLERKIPLEIEIKNWRRQQELISPVVETGCIAQLVGSDLSWHAVDVEGIKNHPPVNWVLERNELYEKEDISQIERIGLWIGKDIYSALSFMKNEKSIEKGLSKIVEQLSLTKDNVKIFFDHAYQSFGYEQKPRTFENHQMKQHDSSRILFSLSPYAKMPVQLITNLPKSEGTGFNSKYTPLGDQDNRSLVMSIATGFLLKSEESLVKYLGGTK